MKIHIIASLLLLVGTSDVLAQAQSLSTSASGSFIHVDRPMTLNGVTIIAPKAGRLMAFNSAAGAPPSDGAVTPDGCWKVSAPNSGDSSSMTAMGNVAGPVYLSAGAVIVFSDYIDASNPSVGSCFTLHKSNAEFLSMTFN